MVGVHIEQCGNLGVNFSLYQKNSDSSKFGVWKHVNIGSDEWKIKNVDRATAEAKFNRKCGE